MPTIILLDNSLSMSKIIQRDLTLNKHSAFTKRDISHNLVRQLIDKISANFSYEKLALVTYSSTAEIVCEFTTDYSKLLDSLKTIKPGESANLEEGLNKVSSLVLDDSAGFSHVQIILITNESDNLRPANSIRRLCSKLKANRRLLNSYHLSSGFDVDEKIYLNPILYDDILRNMSGYYSGHFPFAFSNRLDILCLSETQLGPDGALKLELDSDKFKFEESALNAHSTRIKTDHLSDLIQLSNSEGQLHVTKTLDPDYIENEFVNTVFVDIYTKFTCELKCGHLESMVNLIPNPHAFKGYHNYSYICKSIETSLEVCGFIDTQDLTAPPILSRHVVIDVLDDDKIDDGSLTALLHTCLKSESMVAIVCLGEDWYGALQTLYDVKSNEAKKNSNLVLLIFSPGQDAIQNILVKMALSTAKQQNINAPLTPVHSYSKGCIVWYRENNLVSDVQKVFRALKKINDKMPAFYKELNRVRKAALSIGFYELLQGLIKIIERELLVSGASYTQDSILQMDHSMKCLGSIEYFDYRKDIQPLNISAQFTKVARK